MTSESKYPDWAREDLTNGEILGVAMGVQTEAEANEFLAGYMTYIRRKNPSGDAREIALSNIGYWTGYCSGSTAERVMQLFHCSHPIFGHHRPSVSEALEAGKQIAAEAAKKAEQP